MPDRDDNTRDFEEPVIDLTSDRFFMGEALREALEENPQAKAAWEALSPSRRREILSYLNFLKTPAALERNVQKTIAGLVATDRDG